MLGTIVEYVRDQAAATGKSTGMPGYLAGVYHGGDQVVVASGVANVATGVPMTEDTGFLVGSITKVMTSTLLLQQVERGQVDLDKPVLDYLPEFELAAPAHAGEMRVRNLITHTDGIDADLFFPQTGGQDAVKSYVEQLARCGALFDPGEYVSYSNPGFLVAGRLLEMVTGRRFHDLLEHEIYARVGMRDSCTSAHQAILRSTAVGHFQDTSKVVRPTGMFMLPESWSASGSTPIVTIADLLAFARTHLADGVAPSGARVLSTELTRRMRNATHDMGTPAMPPIGLGWWLVPFGETTALWHGGASPGGSSYLLVVPEHDFAFAAFGNGPCALDLHDRLTLWLLRDYLHLNVPDIVSTAIEALDLTRYEGTYRSNQLRIDIKAIDGQLEQALKYEPMDDVQQRILTEFYGGSYPGPAQRFVPVGADLFAPAGVALESLTGVKGRISLMSFHGQAKGRARYRGLSARLPRRQA